MKYLVTKLAALIAFISIFCIADSYANDDIINNTANVSNNLIVAKNSQKYLYGIVMENQIGSGSQQRVAKAGIGVAGNKRLKIINLGPAVNSSADDYAPTVTANGKMIYFVSNRAGSKELPNGNLSTDFWAFTKTIPEDTVYTAAKVYNIDTSPDVDHLGINTIFNEGVASISGDGKTLYFTGCNRPDGYGDCDIYAVKLEGDKFGKPLNLGKNINSSNFDSQPSITPDGKRLYFTSTRSGPNSDGKNIGDEMDVWYSDWDNDLDEWKSAKNLTEINTAGKDCSPFICADGKSLLFSSDRSGGSGGLDFYVTYYNPSTNVWTAPENLGQPLNTRGDEQFITVSGNLTELYFSSTRSDISGDQGGLDLYMGTVPVHSRTIIITGVVADACTDDPVIANVSVTNKLTGKKVDNIYNESKKQFSHIITIDDFGANRADEITLEFTSTHPTYDTKTVTQKVVLPAHTEDPELAKKHADSIHIKIPVGLQPSITPVIAESEYIAAAKSKNPSLASFRGLVMEEVLNWSLYPLLTYVFFEEGSAEFSPRYQVFKTSDATRNFSDTTIIGSTLNKYYHILNIFGFRLTKFPDEKIEIIGCNDDVTPAEKKAGLSKARADIVFNYLRDIWKIAPERMKVSSRDLPIAPSNKNDSLGRQENRRVEIVSKEWEIYKPIFDKDLSKLPQPDDMTFKISNGVADELVQSRKIVIKHGNEDWITIDDIGTNTGEIVWDWTNEDGKYPTDAQPFTAQVVITTKSGAVCSSESIEIPVMQVSTQERLVATSEEKTNEDYSLILFQFNSDQAGPVNERVMRDYVYGRVFQTSDIIVTGHTDIIGLPETNLRLSERRANTVRNGIQKESAGKYKSMNVTGVGADKPLYQNNIPEGRFYNRTVHVHIESTIRSEN